MDIRPIFELNKIPLRHFPEIYRNITVDNVYFSYAWLFSLTNSPSVVKLCFIVSENKLTTLYNCPKRIGLRMIFLENRLFSSDFLPLTFHETISDFSQYFA